MRWGQQVDAEQQQQQREDSGTASGVHVTEGLSWPVALLRLHLLLKALTLFAVSY